MENWARGELATINLGDNLLNNRAAVILKTLSENTEGNIPEAFSSFHDMKACYRFFSNTNINREKILAPHINSTIGRIQSFPVVLLSSDSTSLDFSGKSSIEGMGRIRSEYSRGFWLHPTLAITPERMCLGVVDAQIWTRDIQIKRELSKVTSKKQVEDKESFKWIQSYRSCCEVARQCPDTQVVNVMDREADLLELFIEVSEQKEKCRAAEIIVRSSHNRISKEGKQLKQLLQESPVLGEVEFTIPSGRKREERVVKQEIKAVEFTPRKKWLNHSYLSGTKINAVTAIEKKPPDGVKPIEWTFLTTLPIETFEDSWRIIQYYLCRWQIEVFFKVLKSGCKIEDNCLKTRERMENLIAVYMILAWRVMYLMGLGKNCPDLPGNQFFPVEVCQLLCKKFKKNKERVSVGEMIILVARLGGYPARKNDPPPGVKVIWKGLNKLKSYMEAMELMEKSYE